MLFRSQFMPAWWRNPKREDVENYNNLNYMCGYFRFQYQGVRIRLTGKDLSKQPKDFRLPIGVGCRIGRLTIVAPTEKRKSGYTVWLCRCDCGGEIMLDTRCLQRQTVTDCGCVSKVRPGQRDITGMRFGKLTAIEPDGQVIRGSAVWMCRCDCGGEVHAPLHQLTAGYRKRCGCLSHPQRKNYIGKRFGRLTVTSYAGKRDGMHRWKCVCDCGNKTIVGQTLLQSGKTKSCGCLQSEVYRDNLKLIDGTSVTILEMTKNRLIASNTSGHTGVYLNRKNGKWVAQITFKGKTYYLDRKSVV